MEATTFVDFAEYTIFVNCAFAQIGEIAKSEIINNKCKHLIINDIIAQIEINEEIHFNMENNFNGDFENESEKYNFLGSYDSIEQIEFVEFRYLITEEEIEEIESGINEIYNK